MYLKKIIASGFKSFADKVTIDLTDGITGIVGPNGSGKSNVVDAIRWVLGEQSVKSLRGDGNMTDVIFSGSKSRNAMNSASVTLVFDNQDHYLALPYDEVEIRRRVYKDGSNEYFINGEHCRLKDVTDLFLDSGVAKESFNIISQGKIEEIISSNPQDRRVIFEEAAQVLKYKKRKKEALRKLEKTKDNMDRVEDIIGELEHRVLPLKEQHDKALEYQEYQEELKELDISLMTLDITRHHATYEEKKKEIAVINQELLEISTINSSKEAKIEEYKTKLEKLDQEINQNQNDLLKKTKEVEQINSQKSILLERRKYEVDNLKVHNQQLELKEQILKTTNDVEALRQEQHILQNEWKDMQVEIQETRAELQKQKESRNQFEQTLSNYVRSKARIETEIESLTERIESSSTLPTAVKAILNQPDLKGIHNAIGSIIEVEEKFSTAITTALGASTSFLIVDDELAATSAIAYLKERKLGRATFFPLNIIQPKGIDRETLNFLNTLTGFIGIASDLVKYNPLYHSIITNQLGNVIISDTLEHANQISKRINYRYRVVTLDGELLHVGGSLTGGQAAKTRSVITDKYELEHKQKELEEIIQKMKEMEERINESDYKHQSLEDKVYLVERKNVVLQEKVHTKQRTEKELEDKLYTLKQEEEGTSQLLKQDFDKEEETLLETYYKALQEQNTLEQTLEKLKKQQNVCKEELEEYEYTLREENSAVYRKNRDLKDLEIEVNRIEVKLDHLLTRLSESYSMTYEKAKSLYKLEMDEEIARNKVSELKRQISSLGNVNLDAIEEYKEVKERYEFLVNQKNDLITAATTLKEIISEMDQVMGEEFEKTFHTIEENFQMTFQELFHGGTASLKLTDPSNILETGIEIIASPPGKKLTSISLLSGGEKTFTAISLLFAILKSRPVPYCILDEVEAALDEVNVDSFGNYLKNLGEKTQFVLITHKKRTMEFADVLYGITMQESGVSKLVSVKLEEFDK